LLQDADTKQFSRHSNVNEKKEEFIIKDKNEKHATIILFLKYLI